MGNTSSSNNLDCAHLLHNGERNKTIEPPEHPKHLPLSPSAIKHSTERPRPPTFTIQQRKTVVVTWNIVQSHINQVCAFSPSRNPSNTPTKRTANNFEQKLILFAKMSRLFLGEKKTFSWEPERFNQSFRRKCRLFYGRLRAVTRCSCDKSVFPIGSLKMT